jgi:hypothetical protein
MKPQAHNSLMLQIHILTKDNSCCLPAMVFISLENGHYEFFHMHTTIDMYLAFDIRTFETHKHSYK